MLEYDNSAFYYFCLSFISIYIIPSWWMILKKLKVVLLGVKDEELGASARTSLEKSKAQALRSSHSTLTRSFYINLALTVAMTVLFIQLVLYVSADGEIASFDPYTILGVDSGSDPKMIKKAYRSKSLQFHPDKNPGDKVAEDMFMKIAKAYEALTDPVAKENYEKFGNPDGKQSMEVSIGLPTYFLDPNNRNFILLAYLIVMVGAIPYAVWRYYSDSSKFGEKNIMYETYSWFYHSLSEHATVKTLPEVFAGAAEFRQGETPSKDEMESVMKLVMSMKSMMQKPKTNKKLLRSNALLHAHLLRKHDMLSEKQREDLNNMLRLSTSLNEAMIKICQHQEWLNTALNCIEFSQNITQAVWIKDNSLLQLPHFSDKEVAQCEKAKGAGAAKCLKDYLHVPDDEKKGLSDMSESDKKDVMTACALIPDISVEHDIYVDDDEDNKVYENDLVTIKVTITRNNLKGGEKAGLIHAPLFPFPKKEAWWVILGTKQGKIIHAEKITSPAKVVSHKIKFLAPPKGEYEFDCFIKSNAYSGLDQEFKVNLTTLDASALPEYKVHPDDKNLDDEPTLFEEMMNANVEEESDSEDEDGSDDESEANGIRELSPEERKKQAAKKAQTDDDDSDSDVEEVHVD